MKFINKRTIVPCTEKITLLSAWGKKRGADRLPEFEYKTNNNTLRHILTSYFPEDKKGLSRPVYLYVEYSFPVQEMEEQQTQTLVNENNSSWFIYLYYQINY